MPKPYTVRLPEAERAWLHTLIGQGTAPARALAHARILLKANQGEAGPGWTDATIAAALEVNPATVARVRRLYCMAGLQAAVYRKAPEREYRHRLDGAQEAPPGRAGVQRPTPGPHALDAATVGRSAGRAGRGRVGVVRDRPPGLAANQLKPWLKQCWCIPPEQDAEFCWRMEDVLEVYTRPYDPRRPQVCLDETSRQLLGEVNPPLPAACGRPARQDYEYQRRGVCNLFMVCEPLAGWRDVMVSDRRTRIDWAHCIKDLLDIHYPDAEQIVLVQDNLNTHTPASLYEAFEPAEAKRLAGRLEIHYTPSTAAG